MNLIKIVAPILGIAALVFGSLQLATIPMPSHMDCVVSGDECLKLVHWFQCTRFGHL